MILKDFRFYIVIIIVLIFIIILLLLTFMFYIYFSYYKYSSGSWIDTDGNAIVINNNGILEDSNILFYLDGQSDATKATERMYINPFFPLLFHKFSAYFGDLFLKFDMVSGTLEIKEKNVVYGTFYKNSLSDI